MLYWAGLNYLAVNNREDAIRNLDLLMTTQPDSPRYADAAIAKADAQADSGNYVGAIDTYRKLLRVLGARPQGDPKAAYSLQQVAVMLDRSQMAAGDAQGGANRWEEAAKAHLSAFEAYPYADGASRALLRATPTIRALLPISRGPHRARHPCAGRKELMVGMEFRFVVILLEVEWSRTAACRTRRYEELRPQGFACGAEGQTCQDETGSFGDGRYQARGHDPEIIS